MYNNKINNDTFLEERKKNLEKIKHKRNNYEVEQQAIYACEKEREKKRIFLYKWYAFKHSLKCLIKR